MGTLISSNALTYSARRLLLLKRRYDLGVAFFYLRASQEVAPCGPRERSAGHERRLQQLGLDVGAVLLRTGGGDCSGFADIIELPE